MDAQRVVRTYFVLSGLYTLAASLIWGVNTLFLLDAGLSIGQVFLVNGLFSAGMVVFELPTGVVADTLGRRTSYLLSVAVLAATTGLYLWAWAVQAGVVVFGLVSVLIGLGFTFYSGALEAWMVDALHHAGGGQELDRVFARAQQVSGVAMLTGTVSGGFLGQLDLGIPFAVRAGLLVVLWVLARPLMVEQGFTPRRLSWRSFPAETTQQARVAVAAGWSSTGLRALMLTSMFTSGLLFWAFYAAQPYLLELLARDAVWVVGVLTAGLSVATMAGNQLVHWLSRACRRRSTLLAAAIAVLAVGAVAMGVTHSFAVAAAMFLLLGGALGVVEPVHRSYLHTVTSSEHRATVASLDSMIGSAGGFGGQVGLGAVSDARSLSAGYVVGGVGALLALPLLAVVRRVGGPGDLMVGEEAPSASCAGEGLPAIAQVAAVDVEEAASMAGPTPPAAG